MTAIDDRHATERLAASCMHQADHYRHLRQLGQSILGKLTLSRGDVGSVMKLFTEKQALLDQLLAEKNQSAELTLWWQSNKQRLAGTPLADIMADAITVLEKSIKDFLGAEEQLERYLSHLKGDAA